MVKVYIEDVSALELLKTLHRLNIITKEEARAILSALLTRRAN